MPFVFVYLRGPQFDQTMNEINIKWFLNYKLRLYYNWMNHRRKKYKKKIMNGLALFAYVWVNTAFNKRHIRSEDKWKCCLPIARNSPCKHCHWIMCSDSDALKIVNANKNICRPSYTINEPTQKQWRAMAIFGVVVIQVVSGEFVCQNILFLSLFFVSSTHIRNAYTPTGEHAFHCPGPIWLVFLSSSAQPNGDTDAIVRRTTTKTHVHSTQQSTAV